MRLREFGLEQGRAAERRDGRGDIVHRLQRETQVIPRDRMIVLDGQRGTIGGDCLGFTVGRGQREAQIVVKLGFVGQ